MIDWRFRWHDGDEPSWEGFVGGKKIYYILGDVWSNSIDGDCDPCETREEAMGECQKHLEKLLKKDSRFFT